MAGRLADVEAQIQNVRQLGTVVTAMRGIAAARAQQGRSLLDGIDAYSDVISQAIGHALALLPGDGVPAAATPAAERAVILFGAEQGFAGTFAERLLDAVGDDVPGAELFLIGDRTIALAGERGVRPAWSVAMTTHIAAIPAMVNHLTQALYDRIAEGAITDVDLIFARSFGGGVEVERHSLLPLDYAPFTRASAAVPPITLLAPDVLLERLAEEYVFAQLYKAAMHAFEAENAARMIAMASAKGNIEAKLGHLTQWQRQLRQDEITEEITELAAGAEALRGQ